MPFLIIRGGMFFYIKLNSLLVNKAQNQLYIFRNMRKILDFLLSKL